jgi:protein associated with RNAse G/E
VRPCTRAAVDNGPLCLNDVRRWPTECMEAIDEPSSAIPWYTMRIALKTGDKPPTRPCYTRGVKWWPCAERFAMLLADTPVTVRALKYDGREYRRWEATCSTTVAGGVVLRAIFSAVVEGCTPFFGGDRAVEYFYTDRGYNVIAGYAPDGGLRAWYCSICTPAQVADTPNGPEVRFIDLGLDLLVWPDGRCVLMDEDEFTQHSADYRYPQEVHDAARAAVSALQNAVRERHHPLTGSACWPFLDPAQSS